MWNASARAIANIIAYIYAMIFAIYLRLLEGGVVA